VELLAPPQPELHLGAPAVVEEDPQGDDGKTLALARADELVDLAPVQEELSRTAGLVVEAVRLQVFGDVGVEQEQLLARGAA
jgi:hypothetical protein